ncbi:urease accessory protein UreE [Ramlibacter sp. AN1015]|uniref:urease accessory protein UreE n=1 Tax=Ramlibacter sp. AN1015 TaxID=3133428 RepID=UPI0030BD35FE
MLLVNKRLPGGQGLAPALVRRAPAIELDWDLRQKSRFDCTDSQGRALGVFLPRGTAVRGGDVLVAQDGSLVRVLAAPQPVLVITPCAEHGSAFDLTRAAYHLGNRHVAIELRPHLLKIEPDHVLADMLRAMHLQVREALEPFEPEGGAYGGHGAHGHGHGHEHGEHSAHGHRHGSHGHGTEHGSGHEDGHGHVHALQHGRVHQGAQAATHGPGPVRPPEHPDADPSEHPGEDRPHPGDSPHEEVQPQDHLHPHARPGHAPHRP